MSAVLGPLSNSPHVVAAAIFDEYGQCVESHLPPPYDPILIQQMLMKLGEAFDYFAALGYTGLARCFAADCEGGSVIMRRIEDSAVVVLVQRAANMAMINVALNVVGLKLRRRADGSQISSSGLLSTSSSGSRSQSSGDFLQDVRMVQRSTLHRLLKLCQLEFGPAAKVLLKQEIARLGVTVKSVRPERYPELVRAIAARIERVGSRGAFIKQALTLVPQDTLEV